MTAFGNRVQEAGAGIVSLSALYSDPIAAMRRAQAITAPPPESPRSRVLIFASVFERTSSVTGLVGLLLEEPLRVVVVVGGAGGGSWGGGVHWVWPLVSLVVRQPLPSLWCGGQAKVGCRCRWVRLGPSRRRGGPRRGSRACRSQGANNHDHWRAARFADRVRRCVWCGPATGRGR